MQQHGADAETPVFLTTREVADLLRVKERKVYDLAAAGEIPHRRITGKLIFPRDEILAWIDGAAEHPPERSAERGADRWADRPRVRPPEPPALRPAVLAGSHDPLLDWAVRETGAGLAAWFDGSRDGLERFAAGEAALCGLHLPEPGGWNLEAVAAAGLSGSVLIAWAGRARGLILGPDCLGAESLADLKGRRIVRRQPGAGAATLFDRLLGEAGLAPEDLAPAEGLARTESDAAAAVAAGEADAALGIAAMAQRFQLGFLPLLEERFDLLIDRRAYFTEPVQALLRFAQSAPFEAKAAAMGGYDTRELGAVRWLSP